MEKLKNREREKGAAMITVLLVSMLLMIAGTGLLLEVSMHTANITDATAEVQAYNAAESGIQSAINVLRGNVLLTDANRIDTTKPTTHANNRIDFRKAVTASTSNFSGDTGGQARLSRWMNYNYASTNSPSADRITLGEGSFSTSNTSAFDVTITDPDNTGQIISYTTEGKFLDLSDGLWKVELPVGSGLNLAKLVFTPHVQNNLDVSSGIAPAKFGSFRIIPLGLPLTILNEDLRFQLLVKMTAPYTATRIIRGHLKINIFGGGSLIQFDWDSKVHHLMGSTITLDYDPQNVNLLGFTHINGTMIGVEPYRVVIRSTGYGPRGAKKILEATVQKNYFNGLTAPATLTLVGPNGPGYVFNSGNSQNVTYSGDDIATNAMIPPVGATNNSNLTIIESQLCLICKPNTIGVPANVQEELPDWLQSTQNLDALIKNLRDVARTSGRYYSSGQTPPDLGNNATGTGITFVDGDLSMAGSGGGILIVTGKLRFNGGFDFNGLIIVTGADGLDRRGGGNGLLQGNIVVAPYDPTNLSIGFKSPKYDISGGGTSEMRYNSSSLANGMTAVSNFVLGVAEK